MAEEKKKILIHTADGDHVVSVGEHKPKQTFGAMPVKDYVSRWQIRDACRRRAVFRRGCRRRAAAPGRWPCARLRSDDARDENAGELRQMTDYMALQIDEEPRSTADRCRAENVALHRPDCAPARRCAAPIQRSIAYRRANRFTKASDVDAD